MGQVSRSNPTAGIQQLAQLLAVESLGRLSDDGRVEPQLAARWTRSEDGRKLSVTMRRDVQFHDGSPADATNVANVLPESFKTTLGPIFDDLDKVTASGSDVIEISFKRPSPFLLESLEVPVRKPGRAIDGTGPFKIAPESGIELVANDAYHLGPPAISRIRLETFPSVRGAWAELLRSNIDMLWEVGPDAFDSLESSTNISVFTFTRRYQYTIAFNKDAPAIKNVAVRQALNIGVDRAQLVNRALGGHGLASSGPVWPKYWALDTKAPGIAYDPHRAATLAGKSSHFTLLMPADAVYERIALELKRQYALIGIEMDVKSTSPDEFFAAQRARQYDAVLTESVSGPTVLRLYQRWQTSGAVNPGSQGNATVDAAFDQVRRAETDAQYRTAIMAMQRAFTDDPPAVFLAWSQRARAVSRRFNVPPGDAGGDVLRTLRLWTPSNAQRVASRN